MSTSSTALTVVAFVVLLLVWAAMLVYSVRAAHTKGYNSTVVGIAAVFFPLVTAIVITVVASRREQIRAGDIVRVERTVQLDGGGSLPAGQLTRVEDTRVIDGYVTARVGAPDGSSHWVARDVLLPA